MSSTLFGPGKAVIGMVHVPALPGSPFHRLPVDQIVEHAAGEARVLAECGFDAVLIENMHDRPYLHGPKSPEVVAIMTRVGHAVREAAQRPGGGPLPVGVQILSGGNREAIAVAQAIGGSFIRCENFVFAHVADEGLLPLAEAGELLRYRRAIGAESVRIFVDIKKKHASHAITADVPIADAAEAARFFGADALVVTGAATGRPTDPADLAAVAGATDLPVLVGSGATPDNIATQFEHAEAAIVGSCLKQFGFWENPLDPARCRQFMDAVDRFRRTSGR